MTFRLWVCFYPRLPESHQQSQLTISDSVTNVNHFLSVLLAQSLVKFCQQLVPTIFPTVSRQWQEAVVGDPPSSLRGFHFRCSPTPNLWHCTRTIEYFWVHQELSGIIKYFQVPSSTIRYWQVLSGAHPTPNLWHCTRSYHQVLSGADPPAISNLCRCHQVPSGTDEYFQVPMSTFRCSPSSHLHFLELHTLVQSSPFRCSAVEQLGCRRSWGRRPIFLNLGL